MPSTRRLPHHRCRRRGGDVRRHAARRLARQAARLGVRRPTSDGAHVARSPDVGGMAMFDRLPRRARRRAAARPVRPAVRRATPSRAASLIAACVDLRRRVARRHPRHLGAGQGGRHRRSPAWCSSWFGVTMYFFRVPFFDVIVLSDGLDAAGHRAVAARDDAGDQPHRRPRRPRRRASSPSAPARSSSTASELDELRTADRRRTSAR